MTTFLLARENLKVVANRSDNIRYYIALNQYFDGSKGVGRKFVTGGGVAVRVKPVLLTTKMEEFFHFGGLRNSV